MNKKTITLLLAAFLFGCSQQELSIEKGVAAEHSPSLGANVPDSVQHYFDQARLGIGDAYVKMAQFYRDGTLGKPDVLKVMQMGIMAEEYKAIPNIEALFKDVPDSDATKMAFQAIAMLDHTENDDSLTAKADLLLAQKIPEGHLLQAMIAYKKGDKEKAIALCDKAIGSGSTIADISKDIILSGTEYGNELQPKTLLKIADRFPMAYRLLGDYYAKIPNDSVSDIPLARQYYLKASDHACLGRREALWVLETIYLDGYPAVDSLIEKRLWSLGRVEINDSVMWLP